MSIDVDESRIVSLQTTLMKFPSSSAGTDIQDYIASLDGIRGISISIVLLSHAAVPGFHEAGGIGVDIFFVLSGYLIITVLIREYEKTGSISLTEFYRRRSLRLFPALLLMSILFFSYAAIFLPDFSARLRETVEALLYVSNWSRAFEFGTSSFLGHTWSLGIEEQFYVLWPVVLVCLLGLSRGRARAFSVALALAAAAALWRMGLALHGASVMRLYNGFDTRCDCVLIGCALAFVVARLAPLWPIGAIGILITLVTYELNCFLPLMAGYTANAIFAALLIAGATKKDTYVSWVLSLSPLVMIGRISYGLYLFHFPIYLVIAQQFRLGGWDLDAVALALTAAISILSYQYVERPCMQIRHSSAWAPTTRWLAYLGPSCLGLGILYVIYNLL
jgi:peptidoglycan/LPS O-acetylase OafA/YrhL